MAGPPAPVQPEVLRWARESAGLTEDEAAHRIGLTSTARLQAAEAGESPLTLIQARKAAQVYQRPLAVLFLPSPPAEDPPEVQFRRLRDAPPLPWPPGMRALARGIPALQDEAAALFEAIDEQPRWREAGELLQATTDTVKLGERLRELVGVSLDDQKAAARTDPQGFKTFRVWREAIEELGVLVLQDGSLSVDDMRGFVSPHPSVPALVINTNDDVRARLFTMLHELAHVFWRLDEETDYETFAATTLMPPQQFAADVQATSAKSLLEKVDAVARAYGVTPDATAVRIGWLRLASWDEVRDVRAAIHERAGTGGRASGGNFYRNVIARMGPRFVGRVLDGVGQSAISELAASRVLGVRVERFESLRQELGGANAA